MQTAKTIPASQVKNNFGAIVNQVKSGEYPEVIVENRGEPMVAIVSIEDLKAMREFKEKEKRKRALDMLREARIEVQARIKGKLTSQEANKIANRFSKEFVKDLEKEGKIKFERKSS